MTDDRESSQHQVAARLSSNAGNWRNVAQPTRIRITLMWTIKLSNDVSRGVSRTSNRWR